MVSGTEGTETRGDLAATARGSFDRVRSWMHTLPVSAEMRGTALAALVAFVIYEFTQEPGHQPYNVDVLVADSLLRGRFDIPGAPRYLELVPYEGRLYSPKGPLIAILLVPFVAIWGVGFDQRHFGALLGAAIAATAWALTGRIGLTGLRRIGAWALPVLGTTIWYEAKVGSLWGVASLGTVLFLMLALTEYFGKRRPWAIGLFCGLAMLCRAPAVLALAGFALVLGRKRWLGLASGLAAPVVLYAGYNLARYGTPLDVSLHVLYDIDDIRFQRPHGAFSPAYLPRNLYGWLFLTPIFQEGFPWLRINFAGQGIFLTSPALLLALGARRERWLWVSLAAVVVPAALFYSTGLSQFGIRYLLDAVPFAFALLCIAIHDHRAPGYPVLLGASIAMNAYGVVYTNAHGLSS